MPIWNCSEWRLPRFTVTEYARLCGPIPRLIPCGFQRTAVNRHPALWSPDLPPATELRRNQRLSGLLHGTIVPVAALVKETIECSDLFDIDDVDRNGQGL